MRYCQASMKISTGTLNIFMPGGNDKKWTVKLLLYLHLLNQTSPFSLIWFAALLCCVLFRFRCEPAYIHTDVLSNAPNPLPISVHRSSGPGLVTFVSTTFSTLGFGISTKNPNTVEKEKSPIARSGQRNISGQPCNLTWVHQARLYTS